MGTARDLKHDRDYAAIGREYAQRVVAGDIPACEWVRLACQRQLEDLERTDWEYVFDSQRAWKVCYFIEQLPHIEGKWKTVTIQLEPWQCFLLTTIFGWISRDTGYRRFRKALVLIPRKNGKSLLAAAIGLYLLAIDGEPGAKIFSAATTRDQAKISWNIAKKMAQRSPGFCDEFGVEALAHSIIVENNAASYVPLSRDVDTLEGLNPHGAVIDELHAHKTRELFDVLDEATGARTQPLMFIISTEGDNSTGVFAEQVNYAQITLRAKPEDRDESYFALIYTIDPEDSWTTTEAWRKANPNLGVSVFEDALAIRCKQAQKNAASQASFLTKRLNVRVGAGEAYFNMLAWRTVCKNERSQIEDFYGQPCVIGLDLASESDVAAKIYMFQRGGKIHVFGKYYLPEDAVDKGNPNYDFYRGWVEHDYLTLTPGPATDFEFIERDLLEDREMFQLSEVGYDPAQAFYLVTRLLAAGLPLIKVPQQVTALSDPMKEVAKKILGGKIIHNGDPVLDWMVGNVVARIDAKENVYPRKARNENKIDGAVAMIIAMNRILLRQETAASIYDDPLSCVV